MNDRKREAEVRGAHLESVLKRAVVPEFPSGTRLILAMADHTGAGFASTMPDHETLEILTHVAQHLVEDGGADVDEDEDEDEVRGPFDIADIVQACPACGHKLPFPRERAVVICTNPLILVSEDTNWVAQVELAYLHLVHIGIADPWTLKKCLTHLPEKPL